MFWKELIKFKQKKYLEDWQCPHQVKRVLIFLLVSVYRHVLCIPCEWLREIAFCWWHQTGPKDAAEGGQLLEHWFPVFLDLYTSLQHFLQITMQFHTLNWKHCKGTKCQWWPTRTLWDTHDPCVELGNHWCRMREDRGRKKDLDEVANSRSANCHWLEWQETNTIGWEGVKGILIAGFIAESPRGMWMEMWGVSQSILVTNGFDGNSVWKGQAMEIRQQRQRKPSLGQLQCVG